MNGIWDSLIGRETLIAPDNIWGLLGLMCAAVFLSIYFEQKYAWASKVSGCILALIFAMILANLGIIPTSCVLYDDVVWGIIVPLAIPMLLLQCNLKTIWSETGRLLVLFLIGAAGTVCGAYLGYFLLKGTFSDPTDLARAAAMMTGSYIGGGVNLAAMASQYAAGEDLTAALTVADNLLMTMYFFVLIFFAGNKWFRKTYKHPLIDEIEAGKSSVEDAKTQAAQFWSRKDISLRDIAVNIAYASCIVFAAQIVSGLFAGIDDSNLVTAFLSKFLGSQYVWITTFSVIVATTMSEKVKEWHGSQEIGTYLIYLFFFVIGVPANIYTVVTKSPMFLVFTAIMVCVNMLFCFIAAKLFKLNLEDAIIASNSNIGGPTTAAGMAISQGWSSLVGPAMLVGTLGYVIGNYLGTVVGVLFGL